MQPVILRNGRDSALLAPHSRFTDHRFFPPDAVNTLPRRIKAMDAFPWLACLVLGALWLEASLLIGLTAYIVLKG